MRARPQDFINPKINNYVIMKTSGTSGTPFLARIDFKHWIVEQAVIWRQWKSFGYKFRDKIALLRSYAPGKGDKLIKTIRLEGVRQVGDPKLYAKKYYLSLIHI